MGLEKRTTSWRASRETLMELDSIQAAFAPFAEDRSSTLRIVIKLVYSLIFTPGTLHAVVESLQRLLRNTSPYDVAQQLQLFPPDPALAFRPRLGFDQFPSFERGGA